jgi:hypothetical protein
MGNPCLSPVPTDYREHRQNNHPRSWSDDVRGRQVAHPPGLTLPPVTQHAALCPHLLWVTVRQPLVHSINSYPQRVRVLHYWIPLTRQTHNFPLSHLCMKVCFPAPIKVVPWAWLADDDFPSNPRLLFKAEFIQLNSLEKQILHLAQFSWDIV